MTAAASSPTAVRWDDAELVITRVFDAPRELVFRAWTQAEHFARWFGPHGVTLPFCRLDARPGGIIHYHHSIPEYGDVWVGGAYDDVVAPERIAFTCYFSDPEGNRVARPGFPLEMSIEVTFDEHPEGTRVTARHRGLVSDQGEVEGWLQSLDRLAGYLRDASIAPGSTRS